MESQPKKIVTTFVDLMKTDKAASALKVDWDKLQSLLTGPDLSPESNLAALEEVFLED